MNNTQDNQGLISPLLRNIRLKKTARKINARSNVLDLACGSGYLRNLLPNGCSYSGVDRVDVSHSKEHFDQFFQIDLSSSKELEYLKSEINETIDVVTIIAILEHIKNYTAFLTEIRNLVRPGGLIIGTTPHPIGRKLHDFLSKVGICSRDAGDEHESFLNKETLESAAISANLEVQSYERFLFGLNQLFVFKRIE